MKRTTRSLNGRQIRGEETVKDMKLAPVGIQLFFFELDRRTQGAFPYSFFEGKPYNKITYTLMEAQYVEHQEFLRDCE
jgi:hypothetical protein